MAIRMYGNDKVDSISYEVLENCGVLSEKNGRKLELRYIAWNGREPKYDIRSWEEDETAPTGEKCGKGITLTGEELEKLGEIIKEMESEEE